MAKDQFSGVSPANADPGLARYFEKRPEHVFDIEYPAVIDATWLPKRRVDGLWVTKQSGVVAKPTITIAYGTPNAFLLVPNHEGTGHDKFSAFSFKRKPAEVTSSSKSHELFQAGVQIILRDAPPEAAEALRAAIVPLVGQKFETCVRAVMTALHNAGFTAGETPLIEHLLPDHALMAILRHGLQFRGEKVRFYVVRTGTSKTAEAHQVWVGLAELATFRRHFTKNMTAKAKAGSRAAKGVLLAIENPDVSWGLVALIALLTLGWTSLLFWAPALLAVFFLIKRLNHKDEKPQGAPIAEGMPLAGDYERVEVSVSMPARAAIALRLFWGSHALFSARTSRVNVSEFIPDSLQPFPQEKPNLATRLKKKFLFAPWVIRMMRRLLCPSFASVGQANERDVFQMMRTNSEEAPNKYNLVCTGSGTNWSLTLSRINTGRNFAATIGLGKLAKIMDWILSKHVLVSGYHPEVPFCGEGWKDVDGVICISGNSGTYQPDDERVDAFIRFLQKVFPTWHFCKVDREGHRVPHAA